MEVVREKVLLATMHPEGDLSVDHLAAEMEWPWVWEMLEVEQWEELKGMALEVPATTTN